MEEFKISGEVFLICEEGSDEVYIQNIYDVEGVSIEKGDIDCLIESLQKAKEL